MTNNLASALPDEITEALQNPNTLAIALALAVVLIVICAPSLPRPPSPPTSHRVRAFPGHILQCVLTPSTNAISHKPRVTAQCSRCPAHSDALRAAAVLLLGSFRSKGRSILLLGPCNAGKTALFLRVRVQI